MNNKAISTLRRIIGVFALLWFLLGLYNFYTMMTITPEQHNEMKRANSNARIFNSVMVDSENKRQEIKSHYRMQKQLHEYQKNIPNWVHAVQGISLLAGIFGSIYLILGSSASRIFYLVSILGPCTHQSYLFFFSDAQESLKILIFPNFIMQLSIGIILLVISLIFTRKKLFI